MRQSLARAARLLLFLPLVVGAALLLYLAAAIAGSLIPRNASWEEPPDGILIFVRNNGIHADLVLPASAAGIELYELAPPGHVGNPARVRGWVAFGWGQREFYLETQRWSDLTVRNAARAVLGGRALMHVEHLGRPQPSDRFRPLRLDDDTYRRLVATISRGFQRGQDGRPVVLPGSGYGGSDVFYEANGHYNAGNTSNQWAADALAGAGVEVGVWTPLAQGLMWWFPEPAEVPPEPRAVGREGEFAALEAFAIAAHEPKIRFVDTKPARQHGDHLAIPVATTEDDPRRGAMGRAVDSWADEGKPVRSC